MQSALKAEPDARTVLPLRQYRRRSRFDDLGMRFRLPQTPPGWTSPGCSPQGVDRQVPVDRLEVQCAGCWMVPGRLLRDNLSRAF